MDVTGFSWIIVFAIFGILGDSIAHVGIPPPLKYKQKPSPDGHRCGVCPTYFQKICAFNFLDNSTFIFDNHCIMDLYNCIQNTKFTPIKYEQCLYFGNFGYVHGNLEEDQVDYGEHHYVIQNSKKNPSFVA